MFVCLPSRQKDKIWVGAVRRKKWEGGSHLVHGVREGIVRDTGSPWNQGIVRRHIELVGDEGRQGVPGMCSALSRQKQQHVWSFHYNECFIDLYHNSLYLVSKSSTWEVTCKMCSLTSKIALVLTSKTVFCCLFNQNVLKTKRFLKL